MIALDLLSFCGDKRVGVGSGLDATYYLKMPKTKTKAYSSNCLLIVSYSVLNYLLASIKLKFLK